MFALVCIGERGIVHFQENCIVKNMKGNSSGRKIIISDRNSNLLKEIEPKMVNMFFSLYFSTNKRE